MSQPLHSTPITDASSLLRAGPPARPHRYSTPRSFCCLAHSLSHPPPCGERALYRHTLSHVSCSSRRSDSRRLYAGHRLANKRAPARLFPGLCTHPGFDAISYFSTLPQRFARARLPDPRLTAFTPPFPQSLTTTVFSLCSMRRLDVSPRRATPKGHKTFIYYTTLPQEGLPTPNPSPAFVAHVHEEVRQQRGDRRSLGSSAIPLDQDAIRLLYRRGKPPPHIQQNPALVGVVFHGLEDEVPRNAVEEGLDVQVDGTYSEVM